MLVCGDSLDPARRNSREPVAVAGALQMVSELTLAVTRACAGQGHEHVGHVSALDTQTCAKRERSCGPTRTSVPLSGGVCDILA